MKDIIAPLLILLFMLTFNYLMRTSAQEEIDHQHDIENISPESLSELRFPLGENSGLSFLKQKQ